MKYCRPDGSAPKLVPPPETQYLSRKQIQTLLASVPKQGHFSIRDKALLLFLYHTGARVQEASDLRVGHLEMGPHARVRLHGKGDKWRVCPLWSETVRLLQFLLEQTNNGGDPKSPVFMSRNGMALTRYGIYKLVRRYARSLENRPNHTSSRPITPHVIRHTTAVHLLESGVEVNVIRGWLGHVSLETTNRYAEISLRTKQDALRVLEPPLDSSGVFPRKTIWRNDKSLLEWLDSL